MIVVDLNSKYSISLPNQSVRYNFHIVETSNLIQPMIESTKDKNFIKEAPIRRLYLCDNCYKYVDETIKKLNDKK